MYGMPVMILAPIASEFQNMPSHHAAPLSSQVWIRFTNDTAVVEACTAKHGAVSSPERTAVALARSCSRARPGIGKKQRHCVNE
ncbi:hypothetical protein NL676_031377 [Syzygium grande]|nr:hypothetical protein NL676_031377 [Syzygium grande]